jgi:oxygen-independent coproporphyrinogen-3 oxidase
VLEAAAANWTVPDGIEITMEANPSSVEAERFRGYRDAGVNRLSLGVQALDDRDLKFLGRLHDVKAAVGAIGLARDIFPRMSFDLIYARPGQTPEAWSAELKEAIGYAADHLSLYQLTIEEGTPFFALHANGKLAVPDQDHAAVLYETTQDVTGAYGLPAYEISNHARPRSRRAWPLHRGRPPRCHLHGENAGNMAQPGRGERAWRHGRRNADPL